MAGVKGRSGTNKGKDKPWQEALRMELYADDRLRLRLIAQACIAAAQAGDVAAIKEIGDRLDGKPHQTSETVAEVKHSYVIETPAPAASVDEWQQQHGASRLVQ